MAQTAVGLAQRRPDFFRRPIHALFMVDKMAQEHVFLRVLRVSPVSVFRSMLRKQSCHRPYTHITIYGINEPAGGGKLYLSDKDDPVWMDSNMESF